MPTYESLLHATRIRFASYTKDKARRQLFTTDAKDLFAEFLAAIPPTQRQHYTCRACQRFIDNFGGLVVINPDTGVQETPVWHPDHAPRELKRAVAALTDLSIQASVTGVFYPETPVLGQPRTGTWEHFSVEAWNWTDRIKTPFQAMAEKLEDHKNILVALEEFSLPQLNQVVALLESDTLYRSGGPLAGATWLRDMSKLRSLHPQSVRDNRFWAAIASAPAGFLHPRSGMLGALLTDLADRSLDFQDVSKRFEDRMAPLKYRRPTAAPTAGNIAAAEKVIEKLGAAGSLQRRFARFEEVTDRAIWLPRTHANGGTRQGEGVFAHLLPKMKELAQPAIQSTDPKKITWVRFRDTVMPEAEKIEYFVFSGLSQYGTIITATNPDAEPIIQWDGVPEGTRNPFSHYLYPDGRSPSQWNMPQGSWVKVKAIVPQPSQWNHPEGFGSQGLGVLLLLEHCRDINGLNSELCLFPSILKSEFHGISQTIEAFSKRGRLTGHVESTASGAILQKASDMWRCHIRVTGNGMSLLYDLDRWE